MPARNKTFLAKHTSAAAALLFILLAAALHAAHLTDRLDLSLVGQNLFDRQHPEQGPQQAPVTAEVPRGFYAKVVWNY